MFNDHVRGGFFSNIILWRELALELLRLPVELWELCVLETEEEDFVFLDGCSIISSGFTGSTNSSSVDSEEKRSW
jgi:hypothetical protein